MVERVEVGEAVFDRARQQGILVEQCLPACDGEQHFSRVLPWQNPYAERVKTPGGIFLLSEKLRREILPCAP
jgi:hypothetical protein